MEKNYSDLTLSRFLDAITDTTHTKDGYVFDEKSDTEICNFFDDKIKTLDIEGIKSMLKYIEYYYDGFSRNSNKTRYDIGRYIQRENVISKIIDMLKEKLNDNPVHFTRSFTDAEQKNLFNGLTTGGFLPKTTDYSHFCHVFGGTLYRTIKSRLSH
jgi:hypothetical protein